MHAVSRQNIYCGCLHFDSMFFFCRCRICSGWKFSYNIFRSNWLTSRWKVVFTTCDPMDFGWISMQFCLFFLVSWAVDVVFSYWVTSTQNSPTRSLAHSLFCLSVDLGAYHIGSLFEMFVCFIKMRLQWIFIRHTLEPKESDEKSFFFRCHDFLTSCFRWVQKNSYCTRCSRFM